MQNQFLTHSEALNSDFFPPRYEIGPKGLAAIAKLRQLRSLEISQLMEDKGFKPKDLINLFADKNMEFLEQLSLVGMPVDAIPDEVD